MGEGTGSFLAGHVWGLKTAGASVSSSRKSVWIWAPSRADAASCNGGHRQPRGLLTHSQSLYG